MAESTEIEIKNTSLDCEKLIETIKPTNPNIDISKKVRNKNQKHLARINNFNSDRKKLPASKRTNLEPAVPRGKPKSGRPWKEPKKKFSTIKRSNYGYRNAFEKKEALRNDLKHVKELSTGIKESKKQEKELKKQRQVENAERRLANERKAEIVQVIKNPSKLKRLRKKQLRQIEKRDLEKIKTV